jgi:large subunit ribosomal protein L21
MTFAVVEIAGQQFKVAPKDKLVVPTLKDTAGSKVSFDRVLLLQNEDSVRVGNPVVKGASVEATVLGDLRDEKVIVFKKKKRKGYRVRKGHRQAYTKVEITKILM